MSEELIQRNLIDSPEKMGDWNFYNIGATTLKALKSAKLIPDKDYETFRYRVHIIDLSENFISFDA